ncbi:unnamed protein product [Caenorhabditis auriculariae]|uniref:AB hydrolase-1 domain-containing protein n=1 Tax=Caenorhabditis auriculariae TaxID=2777116 RepID=A0A8S1H1J2_9PELO|nr:unnamed protein product [Caenorhabditis auriculariae]
MNTQTNTPGKVQKKKETERSCLRLIPLFVLLRLIALAYLSIGASSEMVFVFLAIASVVVPALLWVYSRYITEVPRHYTKHGSRLHEKVEKNLTLLRESYHPSWWCPFGTTQTIVRQVFRDCPSLPFVREIVEFEDGGACGIDWLVPEGSNDETPIVVFLPGITGSTHDCSYILHPVIEARDKGWKSVVVNPRGLGGVKLRTSRTYNAATPLDFIEVTKLIDNRFPKAKKLGCGFSMGGMILWNYLAMVGDEAKLTGAMIISSPWDPMVASDSIERFWPQLVFNRFLANNLINLVKPYRDLFADVIDFEAVLKVATVRQFDKHFITPMFGYKNYEDYYNDAALRTKVKKIRIPTVTLNSIDDCFSPVECIPIEDMIESEEVVGIITNHGGHTAFMEAANPNARGMVEKLLSQWGTLIFTDLN